MDKILFTIKKQGYKDLEIYVENKVIRFIKCKSLKLHLPFFIHIPISISIPFLKDSFLIIEDSTLPKTQTKYLDNLNTDAFASQDLGGPGFLPKMCCKTDTNICLKTGKIYINYLIDSINRDKSNELGEICIVFNILYFIKYIEKFEDVFEKLHTNLIEQEEKYNETLTEKLMNSIDSVKISLKNELYESHQRVFNLKRDLIEYGKGLDKLIVMKKESINKKDTLRFNIERSIMETEEKINDINKTLSLERNKNMERLTFINKWLRKIK